MAGYQLNTKIITDDHKIWLVYAGKNRKFFDLFANHSCIFMANPGCYPDQNTFQYDVKIRQFIRMTNTVLGYVRGKNPNPPNRRLDAYSGQKGDHNTKEGRAFNNAVGNVQRLFREAKPGDLVISPARGHYETMLIGEISKNWDTDQVINVPKLDGEPVPYREVRWIRHDLSRRDMPINVAKSIQNRHAISEIDLSLYDDVYRAVYPSYVTSDRSKIDLFAPKYSGHDPTETYEGGFLVKYFIAAYAAKEKGCLRSFSEMSVGDAVREYYDASLVLEFHQNFNSPGVYSLIAGGGMLAIIVGLAVTISVDPEPLDQIFSNFAVAQGSTSTTDSSADRARDEVQGLIDGIGRDRYEREVKGELGKEAREKLGLNSNITKSN